MINNMFNYIESDQLEFENTKQATADCNGDKEVIKTTSSTVLQ